MQSFLHNSGYASDYNKNIKIGKDLLLHELLKESLDLNSGIEMLNRNEAIDFVENVLKISNVEKRLESGNKVDFLNDLLRAHYAFVPYQNFRILSYDYENRVALPPSVYTRDCLMRLGGTCHALNSFANYLLRALGFNARLQSCTVNVLPDAPNQHLINLVKDVQEVNDLYFFDPASWLPNFYVIPLHNLQDESKIYKNSYQEFKIIREGDVFTRCHRRSKIHLISKEEESGDDWFRFYNFTLQPRTVKEINDRITETYRERSNGVLSGFSFTNYPYGKAVALKNYRLYIYDEATDTVETKKFNSVEEIVEGLSVYCPALNTNLVKKADANLIIEKEYKKNLTVLKN